VVKWFPKTLEHKFEAAIESQLVKLFSVLGQEQSIFQTGVRIVPYSILAIRSNLYIFLTGVGSGPYSMPRFGVDIPCWV